MMSSSKFTPLINGRAEALVQAWMTYYKLLTTCCTGLKFYARCYLVPFDGQQWSKV